ncbi:MAG TPA: proprotein convertase P-domain-containing protein [Anaerolineales bacterium]
MYCNSHASDIPDDDSNGVSSNILSTDFKFIHDLEVRLDISHTWLSDLNASLTHAETGSQINLLDRPGIPASSIGCDQDDIEAILDDDVTLPFEDRCTALVPSISGIYKPDQPLSSFIGEDLAGTWTLRISDNFRADTGSLNEWCLAAKVSDLPASPNPPPNVGSLPSHAQIGGISGRGQALPLDCESRSAVDWAAYFGVKIDEIEFFHSLPESDNPDLGFVGNVYGTWGQIPPYPYGVHAEPVAETLRDYGLEAYAHRPLSWDALRSEIAAGRPVIVWIVGNSSLQYVVNGVPVYYTPSEGDLTVVARYEHTVIVTEYTSDSVSYLNGGYIYTKNLNQFLESWSVMRNMAITARP